MEYPSRIDRVGFGKTIAVFSVEESMSSLDESKIKIVVKTRAQPYTFAYAPLAAFSE